MSFDFLDSLTDAERRALHTKLSFDLANEGTKARVFSDAEKALWNDIGEVLGSASRQPLATFVSGMGYRRYSESVDVFERILAKALPQIVRRPVRQAVRLRLLSCLVDWLRACRIPVSPTSMLQNLNKIEHAVDQQFPGYIAAGLLHRVVLLAA